MKKLLKKLSIVIPCYGSEAYIEAVVSDIKKTVDSRKEYTYEIILVSDASPDGVFSVVKKMAKNDKHIIGIELSRNFGQHAALMAGYREASGDIIVSMDDDGQTPADGIFPLVDALSDDIDVAFAEYPKVKQSAWRRLGSAVNKYMMEVLIQKPKNIYTTSFFACRRFVIDEITRYDTPYPYVQGFIFGVTKRICNVTIEHKNRIAGQSGYSFRGLVRLWANGFIAFSVKPLRISTALGVIVALIGFIDAIYQIVKKLLYPMVPLGYTSTIAAILFIGGIIMIILGMIGEYVGRIYITSSKSPQYVVRDLINKSEKKSK